jgi:hypothetical protein
VRRKKSNPESGYALLLVFAMAAIVAITLYTEVPRVAFEAQRDKEDLLMSRGHEYIRGIALFVRKFNRFPATMDELENTNNQRFLRRRYTDPMTGKADWRLLHAGPGGAITDSIMSAKKDATTQQNFITELKMFGETPTVQEDSVNLATRKRASDQPGVAGVAGDPNAGNFNSNLPSNLSPNPPNPFPVNPAAGNPGYNGPVMVMPDGSIVAATATGAPQAGGPQGVFGIPGAPGASGNGMPLSPSGIPIPPQLQNAQNGGGAPGQQAPPASAASLINQILTSPRPGGINGFPSGLPGQPGAPLQPIVPNPTQVVGNGQAPAAQQVIGGGLAGVASKREREGIKSYNQRTKYNEWEFVYDISKDPTKTRQAGVAGASGAQGGTGGTAPAAVTAPTGFGAPGFGTPGFGTPTTPPGTLQPGTLQPGTLQPGMMQPGMMQPGTMQPGTLQPGTLQPGMMPPATPQPQ